MYEQTDKKNQVVPQDQLEKKANIFDTNNLPHGLESEAMLDDIQLNLEALLQDFSQDQIDLPQLVFNLPPNIYPMIQPNFLPGTSSAYQSTSMMNDSYEAVEHLSFDNDINENESDAPPEILRELISILEQEISADSHSNQTARILNDENAGKNNPLSEANHEQKNPSSIKQNSEDKPITSLQRSLSFFNASVGSRLEPKRTINSLPQIDGEPEQKRFKKC